MPKTLRTTLHRAFAAVLALGFLGGSALAGEFKVKAAETPELKAVFGRVESRDVVPARARLGGTIVSLAVEEGTAVKAGDVVAVVVDDKLALQLAALDSRLKALDAELANATADLERGKKLLETGVAPKKQVDTAAEAERAVLNQQRSEGEVIAPAPGRVLSVPVTKGSVIMAGETVARIAGGGYFLRLSLPERHAAHITEGDEVIVGSRGMMDLGDKTAIGRGRIVKVYPEIEGGRVLADVEVEGLGDFFVGERTRVWIPVGSERMIAVPGEAVSTRAGVDYVRVALPSGTVDVPVIVGDSFEKDGKTFLKVLTGLADGDTVVLP
jgi:RND family efflux transporter MFP subunit